MSTARRLNYSYDDYLRALADSRIKLEFCNGQIYAMAGGTPTHALLGARVIRLVGSRLPAGCEMYSSDLKIRVEATDLSTFPDASVVCGPVVRSPVDAQAVTNPSLIVEVTSRSTEDYDRTEKLRHYQQLPSLQAVIFISHRAPAITVVRKDGATWSTKELRAGERISLSGPALQLAVDEIYAQVELEAE